MAAGYPKIIFLMVLTKRAMIMMDLRQGKHPLVKGLVTGYNILWVYGDSWASLVA